ncbi:hypothetical protein GY973_24390, partial [Escherichia coli]|uniref:hypothetical protein n=1 Tax=Escherichia coli TaxID=562 RepID=UPI0015C486BF|nr:hypothetical protein [Escherichia coli]
DLPVAIDGLPIIGDDARLGIGRVGPHRSVRQRLATDLEHAGIGVGDLAVRIARRLDAGDAALPARHATPAIGRRLVRHV